MAYLEYFTEWEIKKRKEREREKKSSFFHHSPELDWMTDEKSGSFSKPGVLTKAFPQNRKLQDVLAN